MTPQAGTPRLNPASPGIGTLNAGEAELVAQQLTGIQSVDALLSLYKWGRLEVSFGFPDQPSDYPSSYAGTEPHRAEFAQAPPLLQAAMRAAAAQINAVTLLSLQEAPADLFPDIAVAQTYVGFAPAFAYFPGTGAWAGDIWYHNGTLNAVAVLGNLGWQTALHELGHSVGLKHAHELSANGQAAPPERDSLEYTVMTYRSYVGAVELYYLNETFGYPQTLMIDDIAALQVMYGANYTTRSGNTIYQFNPDTAEMLVDGVSQGVPGANRLFLTIWDGGGADTYDFSRYQTDLDIDLSPGGHSRTSASQLALLGYSDGGHYARGNVFNALLHNGDPRSLIENIIGGAGGDVMRGNIADNGFDGGAGEDEVVYAGLLTDYEVTILASDHAIIRDTREDDGKTGTDRLTNIELVRFDDGVVVLEHLPVLRAAHDFNGDGFADILWRHNDGTIAVWEMSGTTPGLAAGVPLNPGNVWQVRGTGDFDADGRSDILWRFTDGRIAIWEMNSNQIAGGGILSFNPGTGWSPVGTGDFNGDGRSDILWRAVDGAVCIHTMNGTSIAGGGIVGLNPGLDWTIVGTGDFNGDDRSDILWRFVDGSVCIWNMQSSTIIGGGILSFNPGTAWKVMGADDFNADGRDDILWRGDDGSVCVWLMNDITPVGGGIVGLNPGNFWQIEGFGDCTGDDRSDILWRAQDGAAALWAMDGHVITGGGIFASVNNEWQMGLG